MKASMIISLIALSLSISARPRKLPVYRPKPQAKGVVVVKASVTSRVKRYAQEEARRQFEEKLADAKADCASFVEGQEVETTMKVGKPGYNRRYMTRIKLTGKCND